eukprot:6839022-Alexandrium_andersonii.AAC.1
MKRAARAGRLIGQRRAGLAGELPWRSTEPRQPPRPGSVRRLPSDAALPASPSWTKDGARF